MPTVITPDPGKPHVEVPAVQVPVDLGHDVCPPETHTGCIHCLPNLFQFFKVIFNTFVICTCFRITGLVNIEIMCCCLGHGGTDNSNGLYRSTRK